VSHKRAKHQRAEARLRQGQIDKEIKLLDTVIELTRQRDELLDALKGYAHMYGTRAGHGRECMCWECCMNDDAQRTINRAETSKLGDDDA